MSAPLSEVLATHRALVCVGTGGVGKTTLSAALALASAMQGRRTMVLTIDPARQLARALGVRTLGRVGEPEDIARCALFLASDDAAFVSGAALVADGGALAAS